MIYTFKYIRNLINVFKIQATFVIIFVLLVSIHQVAPVYNREIQCLADFLKPEECEKLLRLSDSLKATNYNSSIECFQRLANWTLHLKWKQKDTYAMLKNRFRQIGGRTNLVSLIHNCFTRFRREIVDETIDDWGFNPVTREDGEKSSLEESFTKAEKGEKQSDGKFSNSLRSRSVISSLNSTSSDYPCLKLNPYIILGIVGFIVLCVCCSTLVIRRKLANCFRCFKKKEKKPKKSSGKYSPIDAEKGKKSPRKKKTSFSVKSEERNDDDESKVLINTATQDSNPSVRREEDSPPSGCCQCCKKKKKKRKKSTKRKK